MLAAISSIEAEASSVEEACSVAPWLSCSAVAESSWLPAATLRVAIITSPTISRSFTVIPLSASTRSLISSFVETLAVALRLPAATDLASSTAEFTPRVIDQTIQIVPATLITSETARIASSSMRLDV